MMTEDQTDVVEFLASSSTHGGEPVDRIDTHSAIVFLTGTRAYKLKRAVRFDYLDFSTPGRRRAMCAAEVRLNRRTAPTLYRRVIAVTREKNGTLALDGNGRPVDWLVEMNRFQQEHLFDRLAAAGRLGLELMPPLATAVAAFHAAAEPRTGHGGQSGMSWVIEGNAAGFAEYAVGDTATRDRVIERSRAELRRRGALLDERRQDGFVRQCHGDLHLRKIVLLDGQPTLFDGVEFNDEIACTDVLYDLAFLLMDLWRRQLPRHANTVWNRYLADQGGLDGLSLLPLFLSCRAAVRAKTSATAARFQDDTRRRSELQQLSREYLEMADVLLKPPAPVLIAVGGLSGSGKSTLALGLAPAVGAVPGAVVHRSDETRKRLSGVPLLDRLGPAAYTREMSERVYTVLAERASQAVREGHSAIVDAVFVRRSDRLAIEQVATDMSIPFVGLWLDAPEPLLTARTAQRHNDPSDADAAVIRMQRAQETGAIEWLRIDAARPADVVLDDAMSLLGRRLGNALRSSLRPAQ
jgi:aminoglycoside phosphotransferase family enzyme/predicted kinase